MIGFAENFHIGISIHYRYRWISYPPPPSISFYLYYIVYTFPSCIFSSLPPSLYTIVNLLFFHPYLPSSLLLFTFPSFILLSPPPSPSLSKKVNLLQIFHPSSSLAPSLSISTSIFTSFFPPSWSLHPYRYLLFCSLFILSFLLSYLLVPSSLYIATYSFKSFLISISPFFLLPLTFPAFL